MSGPGDDEPARHRGAVRPPPSPEDGPDSVHMPRMEPPPSSLEAMVQRRSRAPSSATPSSSSWLLWVALVVVAAAITGYVMR